MTNPFLLEDTEQKEPQINPFLLEKEQVKSLPNPFLESNFSEDQKQKVSFGRKALAFLSKAVNEYGQDKKIKQLEFTKLLATPAGQYYAEMGARLHADYFMQKAGIPETFELDPAIKYAPHVLALAEASGADATKMKDRFGMAIFLDWLGFKGYGALKNALIHVNKPSEVLKQVAGGLKDQVKNLSNLDDEALAIANKELVRATTESGMTNPVGVIKTGENILKDVTYETTTSFPQDAVIAGVKYRVVGGNKPYEVIKVAGINDKIEQVAKTAKIANEPESIIKEGEKLSDLLPETGQKDNVQDFFKNGIFALLRSPQYYAPKVYELIGDMERRVADIAGRYAKKIEPFAKLEGSETARLVGMVADGHPEAANILASGKLGNEGLKLLDAWRNTARGLADELGLPEAKRVFNYLTHIWDDMKSKDFSVDKELQLWIQENGNFLKKRTGLEGYNLDIIKVAKKYINWAAKNIGTKEFKSGLFDAVEELGQINEIRGRMAEYYLHNYFGTLNSALKINKTVSAISSAVKTNFAQATLGFNVVTPLTNLTQPLIFGTSRIGYKAIYDGYRLAAKAFSGNKYWKQILEDGAILENKSFREINEGFSPWRKLLGDKIVDASMAPMQGSENLNKATTYLGAWNSAYTKIKTFLTAPDKYKRLGKWLEARGVKLDGDLVEESHRYARRETMNTQLDYSRAGQNFIAANPITSSFYMYMTFPIKAGEMVLHNAKGAATLLAKAVVNPKLLPEVLRSPEVSTSLRLATNIALLNGAAAYAGVSLSNLAGIKNFIPNIAPIANVALTAWNGAAALLEKDPVAGNKLVRNLMVLSGFPLASPLWKVKTFLETAALNKDRKDGNWTIINPRSGQERYSVPVWEFVRDMFTPLKSVTSEEYFKDLRESLKDRRMLKNLNNSIQLSIARGEEDKANKIRQNRLEWKQKMAARERIRKQRERERKGGY